MEFEYRGTIYFDIDSMVTSFVEDEWDDVEDFVNNWTARFEDYVYYNIESWMIDTVVTKMKEYEAVKARIKDVQSFIFWPGRPLVKKITFKKLLTLLLNKRIIIIVKGDSTQHRLAKPHVWDKLLGKSNCNCE